MNKKEKERSKKSKLCRLVLCIVLGLFVLMVSSNMALADTIIINGQQLNNSIPFINQEGRILVSLRTIFEALGANIQWDNSTKTVKATKDDTTIILTAWSKIGYKNGQNINLDVPAMIINDRTMIPVRFVSDALGYNVNWDENTRTVNIDSNKNISYNTPNESHGKIISELLSALNCNKVESNQLTFLFLGDYNNANKIKWNELSDNEKLQCAKMKLSKLKGNKSPLCKDLKENQEVIFILSEYGTTGAEINRFNLIW